MALSIWRGFDFVQTVNSTSAIKGDEHKATISWFGFRFGFCGWCGFGFGFECLDGFLAGFNRMASGCTRRLLARLGSARLGLAELNLT